MFNMKEWAKSYYQKHRKTLLKKHAKYRKDNRDKIRKASKNYYKNNKGKYKSYMKKYALTERGHQVNLEKMRRYHKTPKGIYKVIQTNAKRRGIKILCREDFLDWYSKQKMVCYYCSIPQNKLYLLPYNTRTRAKRLTIDRCDNNKGYQIDNMVLACDVCNSIKSNFLNIEEMKEIGKGVIRRKWKSFLS